MSTRRGRGHFTATSGAMFLASRLSYQYDLHIEVTRDNAPWIDLLVSSHDGVKGVGIQVKVTEDALRLKGKKGEKMPDEYQWDVGEKMYRRANPDLLVALVDLKKWQDLPDFYVVTAGVIQEYFDCVIRASGQEPSRWRYHPKVETISHLRNDATRVLERLE